MLFFVIYLSQSYILHHFVMAVPSNVFLLLLHLFLLLLTLLFLLHLFFFFIYFFFFFMNIPSDMCRMWCPHSPDETDSSELEKQAAVSLTLPSDLFVYTWKEGRVWRKKIGIGQQNQEVIQRLLWSALQVYYSKFSYTQILKGERQTTSLLWYKDQTNANYLLTFQNIK